MTTTGVTGHLSPLCTDDDPQTKDADTVDKIMQKLDLMPTTETLQTEFHKMDERIDRAHIEVSDRLINDGNFLGAVVKEIQKADVSALDPLKIKVEYTKFWNDSIKHKSAVSASKRNGLFKVTLLDERLWRTDNRSGELHIALNRISKIIGGDFTVRFDPKVNGKNHLCFSGKLISRSGSDCFKLFDDIICRRSSFGGTLSFSPCMPPAYNFDVVWLEWKKMGYLEKFDITRKGHYILMLMDGDKSKLINSAGRREYRNTCSRLNVASPEFLAGLSPINLKILRQIAALTHFPTSHGRCERIPNDIPVNRKPRGTPFISSADPLTSAFQAPPPQRKAPNLRQTLSDRMTRAANETRKRHNMPPEPPKSAWSTGAPRKNQAENAQGGQSTSTGHPRDSGHTTRMRNHRYFH